MANLRLISPFIVAFLLSVCSHSFAEEDCNLSDLEKSEFFPKSGHTAAPANSLPAPPVENDCAFYKWAWQTFLFVTEKKNGDVAFLSYPTIESAFPAVYGGPPASTLVASPNTRSILNLLIRNVEPDLSSVEALSRSGSTFNDGITQAGLGAVLVDQHRNPIYYTINLNTTFANFIRDNRLDDVNRLLDEPSKGGNAVPADLEFRPGSLEFKSSWMIIEGPVSDYSNYIVAMARVPVLKNVDDPTSGTRKVVTDTSKPPRNVRVALLALHVVGVIDGHPEFVWATFEHADSTTGRRNIAPAAKDNPQDGKTQLIDNADAPYPLFQKGTTADNANNPLVQEIGADQKFPKATSVYRAFPGSQNVKPNDANALSPWEDPAVFTLNNHMADLFKELAPYKKDWRRNYRLVGAIWVDKPREVKNGHANFDVPTEFSADDDRLAGENRLSNMSMESFTQSDSQHCFACHNTTVQNVPGTGKKLPARRINVSHVFTIVAQKYCQVHSCSQDR